MTPGSTLKGRSSMQPLQPLQLECDDGGNQNLLEPTISMTEFFNKPIKITDRRQCDTPTMHQSTRTRMFDPTKTITIHSKAAMNDVVAMFGDAVHHEMVDLPSRKHSIQPPENDNFGIYEDTGTIHGNFEIPAISIDDDEHSVPKVDRLSIGAMATGEGEENELALALPVIEESGDEREEEKEQSQSANARVCSMDPLDENVLRKYECQLQKHLLSVGAPNIIDQQHQDPPVSIQSLLNGETDIELDDEDAYLNVTMYVESISSSNHHIFIVNDLSQDEDTERMLVINSPPSFRAYHLSQALRQSFSDQHLPTQFAIVESVYLYNECSFTLCRTVENFHTIDGMISAVNAQSATLHEKVILFYVTEILRITSKLHQCNMVHCNLNNNSFLLKFGEVSDIHGDWCNELGTGWEQFGVLLQDLGRCLKLDDFVDVDAGNGAGCLIEGDHLNGDQMTVIFQKLIGNKVWCFEVDHFSIFVIIIQLLTQKTLADGVLSDVMTIGLNADAVMQYVEGVREGNGLEKLQNGAMWKGILGMLLMMEQHNGDQSKDAIYSFENMSITERRMWLLRCYEFCATELMDLENLSPKLKIILARLDMMVR